MAALGDALRALLPAEAIAASKKGALKPFPLMPDIDMIELGQDIVSLVSDGGSAAGAPFHIASQLAGNFYALVSNDFKPPQDDDEKAAAFWRAFDELAECWVGQGGSAEAEPVTSISDALSHGVPLVVSSIEDIRAAMSGNAGTWSLSTDDYAAIERLPSIYAYCFDSVQSDLAVELYTEDAELHMVSAKMPNNDRKRGSFGSTLGLCWVKTTSLSGHHSQFGTTMKRSTHFQFSVTSIIYGWFWADILVDIWSKGGVPSIGLV